MGDSQSIAWLIPADRCGRTAEAFRLEQNAKRYVEPTERPPVDHTSSRGDTTPPLNRFDPPHEHKYTPHLQLSFNHLPNDRSKGFCFGTNPQTCDILLGDISNGISNGISNVHFYITFDREGCLILKDSSRHGSAVSYDELAKDDKRVGFTWKLDIRKENGTRWHIGVHVGALRFSVELPDYMPRPGGFEMDTWYHHSLAQGNPHNSLAIYTPTGPAIPSHGENKRPVYIRERTLGRGTYGKVEKVINVTAGAAFARKTFFRGDRENALAGIQNEIRIMRENTHDNIVKVVDYREEIPPFFIMPYFPLGSLGGPYHKMALNEQDTIRLLCQAAGALNFLHERGVAHRDLKPDNILVECRSPLSIQLADFGVAKDRPNLKTRCGTFLYMAPETHLGRPYTSSVDIWSLGVIVLEYVYGLPEFGKNAAKSPLWGEVVSNHASGIHPPNPLIDLLRSGMLQINPNNRLTAKECWDRALKIAQSMDGSLPGGSTTPRPQTMSRAGTNDDGSVVPNTLPGGYGFNANQNDNESGTEYFQTFQEHYQVPDTQQPATHPDDVPYRTGEYGISCDGIRALLAELWRGDSDSRSIEMVGQTDSLISDVVQLLAERQTTCIVLIPKPFSGATVAVRDAQGPTFLADFTPRQRMSSVYELALYLHHLVQSLSSRSRYASTAFEQQTQTGSSEQHDTSRSVNSFWSDSTTSTARNTR